MIRSVICLIFFALFLSNHAKAQGASSSEVLQPAQRVDGQGFYIAVGQARTQKSALAFPALQFLGNPATQTRFQHVGTELYETILNNLTVSGYFRFISQQAYLEDPARTGLRPKPQDPNGFSFEPWRQINTEFLIRGGYTLNNQEITLEIYAYFIPRGELILGKRYRGRQDSLRTIAHTFTQELIQALTGQPSFFLSRIATSMEKADRFREIYVMDWDGANLQRITNHNSLSISPAWSPDGRLIAYTTFTKRTRTKTRNADMFLLDVASGKRTLLSYRQGINSGATFFPDGKSIFLTLSQTGNPDIFRMDLEGKLINRITQGPLGAMNVEPAISPDGRQIAFSSDRTGKPMIHVMNLDGSGLRRLTFQGNYNAAPAWSPDGKKIAFAGWVDSDFDIFIMNSDGTGTQRVTSARKPNGRKARHENPSFSPCGRMLMYSSNKSGTFQIYVSDLEGREEFRITNDRYNYFQPRWSANID
jgi:TolB protein